jgi:hypothetical protein
MTSSPKKLTPISTATTTTSNNISSSISNKEASLLTNTTQQQQQQPRQRTILKGVLPSAQAILDRFKTEVESLEVRVLELERFSRIKTRTLLRLSSNANTAGNNTTYPPTPTVSQIISHLENTPSGTPTSLIDLTNFQEELASYANLDGTPSVPTKYVMNEQERADLVYRLGEALRYQDGYFSSEWEAALLRLTRLLLIEQAEYRIQMEILWKDWPRLYIKRMAWNSPLIVQEEASKCINNALYRNPEARHFWLSTTQERREELKITLIPMIKSLSRPDLVCDAQVARTFRALLGLISGGNDNGDHEISDFLLNECDFLAQAVSRLGFTYYESMSDRHVPTRRKMLRARSLHGSYESKSRFAVLDGGLRLIYAITYCCTDSVLAILNSNNGKLPVEESSFFLPDDIITLDLGVGDQLALFFAGVLTTETYDDEDSEELDKIILRVCTLLMFVDRSVDLVRWLTRQGAIQGVVDLLTRQMMRCHNGGSSSQLVERVLPVLVSLKTLATTHRSALYIMQEQLCSPSTFLPPYTNNPKLSSEENAQLKEKRHFQGHAVVGTPFWYLVQLLTTFEDYVKRTAEELCWTLCNEDADTVIFRCGFGNAAHLLAVQGGMLQQLMAQQEAAQQAEMERRRSGGGGE